MPPEVPGVRPLVIEAAMNELTDKASNPHVPYGPDEVSVDAAACVEAGAAMLHFHARDAQTGDQLWTSTETYAAAVPSPATCATSSLIGTWDFSSRRWC